MKVSINKQGNRVVIAFYGQVLGVDNPAMKQALDSLVAGDEAVLDVGGISSINSVGTVGWIALISAIPPSVPISYVNCSASFLSYAQLLDTFLGRGKAVSAIIDYTCDDCGKVSPETMAVADAAKLEAFPKRDCPKCGATGGCVVDYEPSDIFEGLD